MSQNNMELMVWGDGEPRLTFWDSDRGDDKVFVLNADGSATMETCDEDENMGMFQAGPVNLVEELRKLAFSFSKQAEAEIKRMMQPNNVLQPTPKGAEQNYLFN